MTGTMFLMWLGEQITERGIGNGISMIIFAGIVAGLPPALGGTLELVRTGSMSPFIALVVFALVVGVTMVVVFVEKGQRRILVNYAKRQVCNRLYGEQTARYIDRIITRLTLVGAIYITLVCLLPEFLHTQYNVPFYFGGTSLLITVVVTMDFMAQLQASLMSHQYESLLKKANFKGGPGLGIR